MPCRLAVPHVVAMDLAMAGVVGFLASSRSQRATPAWIQRAWVRCAHRGASEGPADVP